VPGCKDNTKGVIVISISEKSFVKNTQKISIGLKNGPDIKLLQNIYCPAKKGLKALIVTTQQPERLNEAQFFFWI
jgi:hypothetical protein